MLQVPACSEVGRLKRWRVPLFSGRNLHCAVHLSPMFQVSLHPALQQWYLPGWTVLIGTGAGRGLEACQLPPAARQSHLFFCWLSVCSRLTLEHA